MKTKKTKKAFWTTMLWHQNEHHRHGVLGHTLKVTYHLLKKGHYKMLAAGLLHDIAKPLSAYHDAEDIKGGCKDYSFTAHEEFGYHVIKDWTWISDYTKEIVRHHYLIRGMHKARVKGNTEKLRRLKRRWGKLTPEFKDDLAKFMVCDDLGKK